MDLAKGIWQRQGAGTMSLQMYALSVAACFIWTVIILVIGVRMSIDWLPHLGYTLLMFMGTIVGIVIFSRSDKPMTSFVGVSILSFFLGLSIGPILAYYQTEVVLRSLALTGAITMVFSVFGVLFPAASRKLGGLLFLGLSLLLVVYFVNFFLMLFGVRPHLAFWDWFAAALFSVYIWYDWGRALSLPPTFDNAIDAAGALIVDVVNLFMALLRIIARNQ